MDTIPTQPEPEQAPLFAEVGTPHTPEEIEFMKRFVGAVEKLDLDKPFKPSAPLSPELEELMRLHPELMLGAPGFSGDALLPTEADGDLLDPTTTNGENDMGFFDRFKICLCSEVTGVLTRDGQPVVGAEIVRRLELFLPTDEFCEDRTRTDEQGRFSFKPVYSKHRKLTLSEVRTAQKLLVLHEGRTYIGWGNCSSGRSLHEDIDGSYPDLKNYPTRGGFYYLLDFDGDLSRATPLPEGFSIERQFFKGEGFFNHQTVCVGSMFRFVLTKNGEPVHGARVTRTLEHVGYKTYVQTKTSPYDGEVELASVYAPRLIHPWDKTEIRQKIVVEYEGTEYLAWEKTKTNPWEWGEVNLDDRVYAMWPKIIGAELTDPVKNRGVITSKKEKTNRLPANAILYRGFLQVHREYR